MDIFDRIGDTIKSFLDGESDRLFGPSRRAGDSDYREAMDELDDFLSSGKEKNRTTAFGEETRTGGPRQTQSGGQARTTVEPMSEAVKQAFRELRLEPGSDEARCKDAYKQLLKTHHPDRHANHEGNLKKATAKTARLNEAWSQIEAYYAERKR